MGWVTGVHLDDLGRVTPKVFDGSRGLVFEDGAMVLHVALRADRVADIDILNLFEQPDSIAGLSGWDRAYMEGIYATRPGRISTMAQVQSITQAILSAYRGQLEEE